MDIVERIQQLLVDGNDSEILMTLNSTNNLDLETAKKLFFTFPQDSSYRAVVFDKYISNRVDDKDKGYFIENLNDTGKLFYMCQLPKEELLNHESTLMDLIKKEDNLKLISSEYLKAIPSSILYKCLDFVKTDEDKNRIIESLDDRNKFKYIIEYYKYPYNSSELYPIINKIEDKNILRILLFDMKVLNESDLKDYRNNHSEFARENYLGFVEVESGDVDDIDKRKNNMSKIIDQISNDNLRIMDMRVLSSKIFNNSNLDEILVYIRQESTEELMKLSEKEIQVLLMCINHYQNTTNISNWFDLSALLLENLRSGQYSELINSIDDVNNLDLSKRELLYKIIQSDNFFELTDINQLNNYKEITEEKYNEMINGNLEDKKRALLFKLFGISLEYSNYLISHYDEYSSFENDFLKDYLSVVKQIINTEDEELLVNVFNNHKKIAFVDKTFYINQIKAEYGKMYNKGLFIPSKENLISEEKNMYDAGTDFSMIVTVIGSINRKNGISNYSDDWNGKNNSSTSNIFCASYIRPDCLGTVGAATTVTYGFYSLEPSTMVGCYSADAGTKSSGLDYSVIECFENPDRFVDRTGQRDDSYNEINYLRNNRGERQQPDYLVGYRINGVINNESDLLKAQKDFNGIPIVIVDVNKCIEKTKNEVLDMINEYNKTKNSDLRQKIVSEIRRNRLVCEQLGLDSFLPNINIDSLEEAKVDSESNTNTRELEDMLKNMNNYIETEDKSKVV